MADDKTIADWQTVIDFWFPEEHIAAIECDQHRELWRWRMRGGADEAIISRFSRLTEQAANGELNDWANDPMGRLALIVLLDQFSRSVWRDTPKAFAQDPAALQLTLEGFSNGHYESLASPWLKVVHGLPLGHCEGADHLERMDLLITLREQIAAQAPERLAPIYDSLLLQARDVQQVIATFGRHPHRNELLGRESTAAELNYINNGQFPHLRAFDR